MGPLSCAKYRVKETTNFRRRPSLESQFVCKAWEGEVVEVLKIVKCESRIRGYVRGKGWFTMQKLGTGKMFVELSTVRNHFSKEVI